MITDITGIILTPGNNGNYCLGNGEYWDKDGNIIECCCDEYDYLLCCLEDSCKYCKNKACEYKK